MNRINLDFAVDGVQLNQLNQIPITCGSRNYFHAVFKLSNCWAGIDPVVIIGKFNEDPCTIRANRISDDTVECTIPAGVLKDQ